MAVIIAVLPSASSGTISTISPTAMGLVEVISSSSLKIPFMRDWYCPPSGVFTRYQLPVDLYTVPFNSDHLLLRTQRYDKMGGCADITGMFKAGSGRRCSAVRLPAGCRP